jgi:hypothetical protein
MSLKNICCLGPFPGLALLLVHHDVSCSSLTAQSKWIETSETMSRYFGHSYRKLIHTQHFSTYSLLSVTYFYSDKSQLSRSVTDYRNLTEFMTRIEARLYTSFSSISLNNAL